MPIQRRWRRFTRAVIKTVPEEEGAYELANAKKAILRNGSSTNVRRRLITHLISGNFPTVRYFRCDMCSFLDIESGLDKEARHAAKYAAKRARKPKYTKRSPRKTSLFDF